jgi:uncharacterized UBP type Zn finger protein
MKVFHAPIVTGRAPAGNVRFDGSRAEAKTACFAGRHVMNRVKLNQRQAKSAVCIHTHQAQEVEYARHECPECVALGDQWVQLRICMTCGHVGCCDSSKNRHAYAHNRKTGHPIIKTIEPNDDWAWCYVEKTYLK